MKPYGMSAAPFRSDSRMCRPLASAAVLCALSVGVFNTLHPEGGYVAATLPEGTSQNQVQNGPAMQNLWTRHRGSDWPDFLGPGRDSTSPETGLVTSWPATGPRIVWKHDLGEGYGIGSVAQGRIYQFDRIENQARLLCMKAETGDELWRFEYPTNFVDGYGYDGGPRCSPVVDQNRVYLFGAEGMLHCLHAANGKLIWKCDTTSQFGVVPNLFGVGSTPLIEGDLLIAMIGGSPPEDQGLSSDAIERVTGNGSGIVAFDKMTGDVRYAITRELASYSSPVAATIRGRRYCFAFCRGGLVAFEPSTGSIRFRHPWRSPLRESVNASTPVVADDRVFLTEAYGPGSTLLRVVPAGYQIEWHDQLKSRAKAMKAQFNTPVYHDGYLYGCSGRYPREAEIRCIEWSTGKVAWSQHVGQRVSLLFVDGYFVCLFEHGKLELIEANPREYVVCASANFSTEDRTSETGGDEPPSLLTYPCWAAPIIAHGLLYLRSKDQLVCLELIPE